MCKVHNESFKQTPHAHMNLKHGCPKCGHSKKAKSKIKTTEKFVEKARKLHGDRYDYSSTKYVAVKDKVDIICPVHGLFQQTPDSHLQNHGCEKCGKDKLADLFKKSPEKFILEARAVHGDKYGYDNCYYTGHHDKVAITCRVHQKDFLQDPMSHLKGYEGCVECVTREWLGHSNVSLEWLYWIAGRDEIEIQHADNGKEYRIPNTWLKCDGYCKETNTVFEFYGSFYHGNPRLFPRDYVNPVCKKTMGELYDKTMRREEKIRNLGYNVVTCWEDEWNYLNKVGFDEEVTEDKMRKFLGRKYVMPL